MRGFDKDVWRQRAWDRFQRHVRGETHRAPSRGAETQWVRDVIYVDRLACVVEWAAARKLVVVFAKRSAGVFDPNTNEIIISSRARPERQLYYLLHECGHYLIGCQGRHERFQDGYPSAIGNPQVKKTFKYKITCLEEELEAWHRGWKLAKRIGLGLDKTAWDEVRLDCLRSYAEWTTDDAGVKYETESLE